MHFPVILIDSLQDLKSFLAFSAFILIDGHSVILLVILPITTPPPIWVKDQIGVDYFLKPVVEKWNGNFHICKINWQKKCQRFARTR